MSATGRRAPIAGRLWSHLSAPGLSLSLALGCGSPAAPPKEISVSRQIVSPDVDGTDAELLAKGDKAMDEHRYADAKRIFTTLLLAKPKEEHAPHVLFQLATASDRLDERKDAGDRYQDFAKRFPKDPRSKLAELRVLDLLAYLEAWEPLFAASEDFLKRADLDGVDRITGLGARALSRVERGEASVAMHDVQSALDLVDELSFGKAGKLPPPVAQLEFALGEVRRVRSEEIHLAPDASVARADVPRDFLRKMEARCQGLLDAQSAYAEAMHTTDAHWIAMAGYRVGDMYRTLHRELMRIPPTPQAKTASDEQLFFAIMHVRYRVLLEKGLEMLKRTLVLQEKALDDSEWIKRAVVAKGEIEKALDEERALIKTFPFEEKTIERTIELMQKKANVEAEKRQNDMWKHAPAPVGSGAREGR